MHKWTIAIVILATACGAALPSAARAQTPATPAAAPAVAPPPPPWKVTAGLGLAVSKGNSETSSFNATYTIENSSKTRNAFKSDGLFLRGTSDGTSLANKLSVNLRDQYQFGPRAFVFGQTQYLHDEFKDIDYLVAPTAGVGLNLVATDATKLSLDLGAGGVWEKNPGARVDASGAFTVGERFSQALSPASTFTQNLNGLWPTTDYGDYLLTLDTGIAAAVSTRTQLKVQLLDSFKNRPAAAGVKRNDTSFFVTLVFKS